MTDKSATVQQTKLIFLDSMITWPLEHIKDVKRLVADEAKTFSSHEIICRDPMGKIYTKWYLFLNKGGIFVVFDRIHEKSFEFKLRIGTTEFTGKEENNKKQYVLLQDSLASLKSDKNKIQLDFAMRVCVTEIIEIAKEEAPVKKIVPKIPTLKYLKPKVEIYTFGDWF